MLFMVAKRWTRLGYSSLGCLIRQNVVDTDYGDYVAFRNDKIDIYAAN